MEDDLEIYVLCDERTKAQVDKFLSEFLPNRDEAALDYPYPEFDENSVTVFRDVSKLVAKLEKDKRNSYSIYWNNKLVEDIKSASLHFTSDGCLIAGIVVGGECLVARLKNLNRTMRVDYGFVSFASVPPKTRTEFVKICEESGFTKIYRGKISS